MTESLRETITTILNSGSDEAVVADQLMPLLYEELKKLAASQMAKENPGQTLQPTALVHEAYMRLVADSNMHWESRGHFFAAAARTMRQILINRAVRRKAEKHGGKRQRAVLFDVAASGEPDPDRMLDLDQALQKLEERDPRKAQIVMLRFFAGLSVEEIGAAMALSSATVRRDWQFARTWLHHEMNR